LGFPRTGIGATLAGMTWNLRSIRPPAVAGAFYPGDPGELRETVEGLLAAAPRPSGADPRPKAVIAPHAGYVYSGPIAATAFAAIGSIAGRSAAPIRRVVLLGPAHRVPVDGLALPGATAFATPLGAVEVDAEAVAAVSELPQVVESAAAHAPEHSLEVELPFLQVLLGEFRLLPLVVGDADGPEVAEVLERVWGGEETAIVVSSDLSHYMAYDVARRIDEETSRQILDLAPPLDPRRACGARPIDGLLVAARRRRLAPELLDLRSSGDTAGDRRQVVGYGAFAFRDAA
jgi:AmmeMemoRadiSam system protein B